MKKVFISSTCYNLRDARAVVERCLMDIGFEPILSDRLEFPVNPNQHRHDVCLENVKDCDLFLLIQDNRLGAPYYKDPNISITMAEYNTARLLKKPTLVFVRKEVWNERLSWTKNQKTINYIPAFVDNNRVFEFLDSIQANEDGLWIDVFNDVTNIIDKLQKQKNTYHSILTDSKNNKTKTVEIQAFNQIQSKDSISLSKFSQTSQEYILSTLDSKNKIYEITLEQLRESISRIIDEPKPIGPVIGFEVDSFKDSPYILFQPIRPMDEEGNSWMVMAFPTATGIAIRNELVDIEKTYT